MEKGPSTQEKEAEEKLHQQYMELQREWDTIKQSKQLRRSLTRSRTMVRAPHLLDSSPRNLMSSLQHRRSPSDGDHRGGGWKVKKNGGLTVEEILKERRAAIQSGKLKGRRLFEPVEDVSEVGLGGRREEISIWGGWDGLAGEEREVRSLCSYDSDGENENVETKEGFSPPGCPCSVAAYSSPSSSSSSSSFVCEECVERLPAEGEEKVEKLAASVENEKKDMSGYGTRSMMVLMVWLVIGLIVCAIGMISMRTSGVYGDGNEVIPVPT